jgi:hypothetical protein
VACHMSASYPSCPQEFQVPVLSLHSCLFGIPRPAMLLWLKVVVHGHQAMLSSALRRFDR